MVNLKDHRSEAGFSILNKLVIFFGILVLIAGFILGAAAFYIAKASVHELADSIQTLKNAMRILWFLMVVVLIIITIVLTRTIVRPIKRKKEISYLSTHFNSTILKIGDSVKLFDTNIAKMQQMGNELASNITETASTINRIQTLAQTESVTETMEN
ncbi:chemotaxis protein [Treponema denticola]|uniref:chemotaxis protein n=1 Tax=Treponema denticola TaxID=158 RepID=UPI0020A23892|nr:chemotaxis protein [Treponema denticola]UTC83761.1 chemotaxis protein [Treponema denticola]